VSRQGSKVAMVGMVHPNTPNSGTNVLVRENNQRLLESEDLFDKFVRLSKREEECTEPGLSILEFLCRIEIDG